MLKYFSKHNNLLDYHDFPIFNLRQFPISQSIPHLQLSIDAMEGYTGRKLIRISKIVITPLVRFRGTLLKSPRNAVNSLKKKIIL